jgi:nicotinate-nucleotide--dimethylbenzimidazole phosphoribosyltransferase
VLWPRPVPVVGDQTSAAERAKAPDGWRFAQAARDALHAVVRARRDVRRFRPDPVPEDVLERVLAAAHAAPSVGHSQPWRFVVVDDPALRDRAAVMADGERLAQAEQLDPESARHLLDLQLEGIREAPLGVVVCCDRRVPAAGVLGRATFPDADVWSCACAIENLWLAARAEGLGVGWVTLFEPAALAGLVGLPEGVVTLGWLCLGWPDERPPEPGLERAGWSRRAPLHTVVLRNRWPEAGDPAAPPSRLRAPDQTAVVGARDDADTMLTPLGSLGVLDRAVDRVIALGLRDLRGGSLVVAAGRHRVVELGVSAFAASVTDDVLAAARAGRAVGAVAARTAGLDVVVVDAGAGSVLRWVTPAGSRSGHHPGPSANSTAESGKRAK